MAEAFAALTYRVLLIWTRPTRVAPATKKALDTFPLITWNTILCHYIDANFKHIAEQEDPPLPADLETIPWEGSLDFGAYMCHTLDNTGKKFKGSYSGAATGLGASDLTSGLDGRQKYHNFNNVEVFDKCIFHDELVSAKIEGRGIIWSQTFCIPVDHVNTIDSDAVPVLPTFNDNSTIPTVPMNLVAMKLLCRLAELFFAVHFKAFTITKAGYRYDVERCCPWYDDLLDNEVEGYCTHSPLNEGIGAGELVAIERQEEFDEAWKVMREGNQIGEDLASKKRKLRQGYMNDDELAAEEGHQQARSTEYAHSARAAMTGAERKALAQHAASGLSTAKTYLDRLGVTKVTWTMTDLKNQSLWPDWDTVTEEELKVYRRRIIEAEKVARSTNGGTRKELATKKANTAKKFGNVKASPGQSKLNFAVTK